MAAHAVERGAPARARLAGIEPGLLGDLIFGGQGIGLFQAHPHCFGDGLQHGLIDSSAENGSRGILQQKPHEPGAFLFGDHDQQVGKLGRHREPAFGLDGAVKQHYKRDWAQPLIFGDKAS